jgi:hypothetical protein
MPRRIAITRYNSDTPSKSIDNTIEKRLSELEMRIRQLESSKIGTVEKSSEEYEKIKSSSEIVNFMVTIYGSLFLGWLVLLGFIYLSDKYSNWSHKREMQRLQQQNSKLIPVSSPK